MTANAFRLTIVSTQRKHTSDKMMKTQTQSNASLNSIVQWRNEMEEKPTGIIVVRKRIKGGQRS